jgi:hypothetical protein
MIYIKNKEDNTITTDVWSDFIANNVAIYIDDMYIGTYKNESTKKEYIVVTIPSADLISNKIENKEYNLKFVNKDDGNMIKIELVVVKNNVITNSNSVVNNKKIKFYE